MSEDKETKPHRPEVKAEPFDRENMAPRIVGLCLIAVLPFAASGGMGDNLAILGTALLYFLTWIMATRTGQLFSGSGDVQTGTPVMLHWMKFFALMPMVYFGYWFPFLVFSFTSIQVALIVAAHSAADKYEAANDDG